MKSKITLYYKSLLNQDKNFILDNLNGDQTIETYLSTLQSEIVDKFQYIKQQLSVSIKINSNQTNLEMVDSKDLNYVKIQNYDVVDENEVYEKAYYYFVVNKIWRSKETIEIILAMDTINTFKFNSDYLINAKTITKRMHKDRFDIWYYGFEVRDVYYNHIYNLFPYSDETPFPISIVIDEDLTINGLTAEYWDDGNHAILRVYGLSLEQGRELFDYIKNNNVDSIDFWNEDESVHYCNIPYPSDVGETQLFSWNRRFPRNIDLKSEEISAPVYKKDENIVYENEGKLQNAWALYYRTDTDENSPIRCYLIPDTNITIQYGGSGNKITPNDVPSGQYLFFYQAYNGKFNFIDGDNTYPVSNGIQNPLNGTQFFTCVAIKNNGGTLELYQLLYLWTPLYHIISIQDVKSLTRVLATTTTGFEFDLNTDVIKARQMTSIAQTYDDRNPNRPFRNNWNVSFNLTTQISYMNSIDSIDRTLSQNIKIIDIPYSPSTIEIDSSDNYVFEGIWQFDSLKKWMVLNNLNTRFENTIVSNVDDILQYYETNISIINWNANRYIKDSKLFHSDYFRPKFVYDSFSKEFALEQIDYGKSIMNKETSKMCFDFVMSRNIVSKFLFRFKYTYKNSTEDYPNIVAVARNNEEVIYNSQYLNYIRTGYNYDLKTKERNEVASGAGLGLSIAGLIASIALTASGYGTPIGVAGIVGSVGGIAGSIIGFAKSTAQAEDNIQRKLQESQRQAVSVLNADDSDLLYAYTQNKAKLCLYEVSDNMKNVLDDLFYYVGYIVNEQMIPTIDSRYWFNFVQATLVINDSSNLSKEIEDDIKERFEQGVTFLHYHGRFDFEQNMENWETSLL